MILLVGIHQFIFCLSFALLFAYFITSRLLLTRDRRPGIAEQRAEAKVVFVAFHLNLCHMNGVRHSFEGWDGIGAHDLRGDKEVNAVH
jgi:hypothetical protein